MARTINSTLTRSVELVTGGTNNPLLATGTGGAGTFHLASDAGTGVLLTLTEA